MGSTVPAEAFAGLEWHYLPTLAAPEAPVAVWAAPHDNLASSSARSFSGSPTVVTRRMRP
jgi:hypothetical protein